MNKDRSNIDKCFNSLVNLCKFKERCSYQLYNKLVLEKKYDISSFVLALNKAKNIGLCDDNRYAESYIQSEINSYKSSNMIISHLCKMNIDYTNNQELMLLVENAKKNDIKRALSYINKHPIKSKNKYKSYMNRLLYRGYSYEVAKKVILKYLYEH